MVPASGAGSEAGVPRAELWGSGEKGENAERRFLVNQQAGQPRLWRSVASKKTREKKNCLAVYYHFLAFLPFNLRVKRPSLASLLLIYTLAKPLTSSV